MMLASIAGITAVSFALQVGLGTTTFPTSAEAPAAQEAFVEGVLLLHSFEYERARDAFQRAQQVEPTFAMAYWGEVMTWNHPVWFRQYRDQAVAALQKLGSTAEARRAKAPTAREQAYLDAVSVLFGDGPKAQRDTLYMESMRALHARWPDDENAAAFYALSILGTSHGGRDTTTYLRAAAVAESVFANNPQHPGGAHYLIHSYDDPIHAHLGLPAARAYSGIAPDAAHAQHMTTHIFLAMGMWDEVVSQNIIAANQTGWGPGHYTSWLAYGYLQQERDSAALALLERARRLMGTGSASQRGYLVDMRGQYVICTERWDSPILSWDIDTRDLSPAVQAEDAFVRGMAALHRGDVVSAERQLTLVERATQAARGGDRDVAGRTVSRILDLELRALVLLAKGDDDNGLTYLARATQVEDAMPFEFGPPAVVKPSHELYGEVLAARGRGGEAQRHFSRQLELTPNRALTTQRLEAVSTNH